jgi:hypothetical protein
MAEEFARAGADIAVTFHTDEEALRKAAAVHAAKTNEGCDSALADMMAAGTGMDADDIREVEEGKATDQRLDHYAEWFARLEAWPPEKRAEELLAASGGSGVMHLLEQGKGEV